MKKKKEQFQYTFKIIDSNRQYIETAYSEAEARSALATALLKKEGYQTESTDFARKVEEYQQRFRLVFLR